MYLSDQQVSFFRSAGYLRFPEAADNEILDELNACVMGLIQNPTPPLSYAANGKISRISNALSRHPIFLDFFSSSLVLDPLESLLGPNIVLLRNRHNHITLNERGMNPVRLHRDVLQWSRPVITVVLYLEDANAENGCTRILPTSQFLQFIGKPNNGGTWMDEHEVYKGLLNQALDVPMRKGEMLVFDSLCFHTPSENDSDRSRISVTMAYHSVDELNRDQPASQILVRGNFLYRGNDVQP